MSRRVTCARILLLVLVATFGFGDELDFYLRSEPKTFNPILVADDSSETIRYLTGGVLIRINRQTQQIEPDLATSWKVSRDGKSITFTLRPGVKFSDGTAFTAEDVKYTMDRLMDPSTHSPTGDAFRSGQGTVRTIVLSRERLSVVFPAAVAGMERLFDQVPIMSATSPQREFAVLGPFFVAEHQSGAYVLLRRNPYFWKRDESGRQLPYLDAIRLEVQPNRDIEMLKFSRNEIQLITSMDADYFDRLSKAAPGKAVDAGPSLDSEQLWFNQVPGSPIEPYRLEWFQSHKFRRAISSAINRGDLCRVVYGGHAIPARGPISPANKYWFNTRLPVPQQNTAQALQLLREDGFQLKAGRLSDRHGHPVEFSIVTNAGNRMRERMATMIQADLKGIGISVNVVTLDFPSLIQRITETFNYEAALLGMTNMELDPNTQMNIWLSSSDEHQWNPRQKSPATPWEAEIDRLMRLQASTLNDARRKQMFDRVQEIVVEQAPFIYLVNKDTLVGVAPTLVGVTPVAARPQTYWNIERLSISRGRAKNGK
ncbi:MAG TPA: ABC transporter substrate-binding protein [Terriglobales bacterium]|nr:ABC transporter substrate-binding protein [Dongiaceae bacterium]HVO61406.1 ABC transporter substrate-binding protein [Terriglobales bacterium]